jgi:cell division protein FtsB
MNYQDIFNFAAGTVLAVTGWFARQLWDAVKSLQSDLSALREEIAKDYTRRDDFKEFASEIRQMFREISDKLDKKADK